MVEDVTETGRIFCLMGCACINMPMNKVASHSVQGLLPGFGLFPVWLWAAQGAGHT